jgi:hypothetical protein
MRILTLDEAYRARWWAVAVGFSAVFGLGPLASDGWYWITGDDVHDVTAYGVSAVLHGLVMTHLVALPALKALLAPWLRR